MARCGGRGSSVANDNGHIAPSGNQIDLGPSQFTGTQRSLAMNRIGTKYEEFYAAAPATAMGRLASYVKSQPEFKVPSSRRTP